MKKPSLIPLIFLVALAAGCDSSSDSDSDSGRMSLRITDAPIDDATEVVVQFSAVQIRSTDESQNIDFNFDPPKSFDLLSLQGGETESLFSDEKIPSGTYDEVRLIINAEAAVTDSYIVLEDGGGQHDLTVPSGAQSGLKVKGQLTVPANGQASFTIDFDVRKSIVKSGNPGDPKYHLKPVLRLVEDTQVGTIAGVVDAALLTADTCSDTDSETGNAVYIFEGAVTPDDIDEDDVEPVVTALVKLDTGSGNYEFRAAFLLAGEYTISFTCNADEEDIEDDDDLKFTETQQNILVEAAETTQVSFPTE